MVRNTGLGRQESRVAKHTASSVRNKNNSGKTFYDNASIFDAIYLLT